MAKKMSMMSVVLAMVVVLALVYFFRPQTFNFLKQGFTDEGFVECPAGMKDDGDGNCVEGFFACGPGEKEDSDGNCVPVEGFFGCTNGVDDDTGEAC